MQMELAGALRERVAIEAWIEARDDTGGDVGFWAARGLAYAAVEPDGGSGAVVLGDARQLRRRWRVTLRMPVVVTLTCRLIWQSQILAVLAVEDDPRAPDRLSLRCEVRES